MNKVQLIYNPYKESSRILINGNSISEYSQLANFLQESFEIWCPVILEHIEQELNDDFALEIVSDEFHSRIIKARAERQECCLAVVEKPFPICLSVQERLEKLSRLESNVETKKLLFVSKNKMLSSAFLGELCKIGIYDSQHSILHMGNYKIECETASDSAEIGDKEYDLIIVGEASRKQILEMCSSFSRELNGAVKTVGLSLGDEIELFTLPDNMHYIGADIREMSTVLEMMIHFLIWVPFIKRRKTALEYKYSREEFSSQEEQLDFLLIDAVEPLVVAYCEQEVEEGKSIKLNLTSIPSDTQMPDIAVRISNPSVLSYKDGNLLGLMDGETNIEVSISGSVQPIYHNHIRVKRVVRIKEIYIEYASVVLKEGTNHTIAYRFEPKDADNIDEIKWISTNENVVRILSNGCITCVKEGECDIIVRTDHVKAACSVSVKPDMKRILLPESKVTLSMGQQISFVPEYEPKNCYDSRIFVTIDNPEIVVMEKGRLISKGLGKTNVMFHNAEKTVKSSVEVVVESTLYASEKGNIYKKYSFFLAVASVFLLAINKACSMIGVISGIVMGILAVMRDCENVEGMVNVRGEPMKPDYFGSILFIVANVLIGVFGMLN